MLNRLLLIVGLCLSLLLVPVAYAGQWDYDEFYPDHDIPEGRGKTILVGATLGAAAGFVASGLILALYWNPDADNNFDTVMLITVPIFTMGGMALGLTLPPNAAAESAAASIQWQRDDWRIDWRLPTVTARVWNSPLGRQPFCHANLLKLDF